MSLRGEKNTESLTLTSIKIAIEVFFTKNFIKINKSRIKKRGGGGGKWVEESVHQNIRISLTPIYFGTTTSVINILYCNLPQFANNKPNLN